MPTIRVFDPTRILTFQLYRAPNETNQGEDIEKQLCNAGIVPHVSRQNPSTHDVWSLALDLAEHHEQLAAVGVAVLGIVTLWLKQRKGRRVEIHRPDLKIKASSAQELKRALNALNSYDTVQLLLSRNKQARKPPTKRKPPKRP